MLIREERNHCEIYQIVPRSYLALPTKAYRSLTDQEEEKHPTQSFLTIPAYLGRGWGIEKYLEFHNLEAQAH